MSAGTALYPAFSFISIYVLKLVNENVQEPYMVAQNFQVLQSRGSPASASLGRAFPCPTGASIL